MMEKSKHIKATREARDRGVHQGVGQRSVSSGEEES